MANYMAINVKEQKAPKGQKITDGGSTPGIGYTNTRKP